MRIAVINTYRQRIGGTESYLNGVLPELLAGGDEIVFLHEFDNPASPNRIRVPDGVASWCVSDLGPGPVLTALAEWRPDLLYVHSVADPDFEEQLLRIAPAVLFAHDYRGTCISGHKSFKFPTVTPCNRRFGLGCLVHYFPHRCGGRNPITMLRLYRLQARRLVLASRYREIIVISEHMRAEYLKHGFTGEHVHRLPYCGPFWGNSPEQHQPRGATRSAERGVPASLPWRIFFVGRMDRLKGGQTLLAALPGVRKALNRDVALTFVGDGPYRSSLERQAQRVLADNSGVSIKFTGWASGEQLQLFYRDCDLLAVPSLWPEPFGVVGLEAGRVGVPAVAFAVGGVRDWLTEGVNGYLAPGDPPTADGLVQAICKCLQDPATYARLCEGAGTLSHRFTVSRHLEALQTVLAKATARASDPKEELVQSPGDA